MKLHVLGTGNAGSQNNYNTCFVIQNNEEYVLVDAGGGNGILKQLVNSKIDFNKINHAFISHNHADHLLGFAWVLKIVYICFDEQTRQEPFTIYGHKECIDAVKTIGKITLGEKKWDKYYKTKVMFVEVKDDETKQIAGLDFHFFDTEADITQLGFVLGDKKFVFCGDVSLHASHYNKFMDFEWVALPALCIESELRIGDLLPDKFYTVKKAAQVASRLNAKNLIIWHTEDVLDNRKAEYTKEAQTEFGGNVYVPEDLEVISIE